MQSLSVIIPWCNREELKAAIDHNLPIFRNNNIEVIIVNFGGESLSGKEIFKNVNKIDCLLIEVKEEKFNKCIAQNIGVYKASREAIFLLDSDILLAEDFIPTVLSLLKNKCYITVDRVFETNPTIRKSAESSLKSIGYGVTIENNQGKKVVLETNSINPFTLSPS